MTTPNLRTFTIEQEYSGVDSTPRLRTFTIEQEYSGVDSTPRLRTFTIEAHLDPEFLAPADPVFGSITGEQINGDPKGRTKITLNFTTVTESQVSPGEHLGQANGSEQVFVLKHPNVKTP